MIFAEFLQTIPPGKTEIISDLVTWKEPRFSKGVGHSAVSSSDEAFLSQPKIQIFCNSEPCQGLRFFKCIDQQQNIISFNEDAFVRYLCCNCQRTLKTFALKITLEKKIQSSAEVVKYGEFPPFGDPTPARVISLVGPDRDYFLKGRRCEFQGLGIGAFAYYRRIIETQKGRLLDEIIRVSLQLSASPELIAKLETAKQETQFSRAVESVKDAIPDALRIDGHNPLVLLHKALSEGLHAQTDEQCLEYATSIRLILFELADRMSQILKDRTELRTALSKLL